MIREKILLLKSCRQFLKLSGDLVEEDEFIGVYIFDAPPDGMDIVFPIADGLDLTVHIDDEQAEFIVQTIQNKLNGRFK